MKFARRIVAEAGDRTDRFHGRKASHQPDHRAQDAKFGAAVAIVGVVRITDEAAITGLVRLPATIGADLTMKLPNRSRNEWHSPSMTKIVHDQASPEIIAAIENNIDSVQQ